MAKEVLIVDDDRALARSLVRAVESQGYTCRQVHDGNEAIKAISENVPDLILLDMLLPKKDGYGVMESLKSRDATRNVKIIAISGIYRGRDHVATAMKAGADEYLEKPFSASDLTENLVRHLGKAEVPGEAAERADKTSIKEQTPAETIWRAIREDFSGAIHFQDGKRHKILVLDKGTPRFLRSNLAKEALGQRLLRSGRIGEKTYSDSLRRAKATGRRIGEILVEMGAVQKPELDRVLSEQAEDKMLELFSWAEGDSWRQAGVRSLNLASELLPWGLKETILRGAMRMRPEVVREQLARFSDCTVSSAITEFDGFEHNKAVADALAAIDGEKTVQELSEGFGALLFALYLVGGVRFDERNPATEESKAASTAEAVGPTSSTNPVATTHTNLDTELKAMLERMREQNFFEILGLEPTATTSEIRKAFIRKAKIYHPDKVGAVGLQEVAGEVFALISDAHQTLGNESERESYLQKLESGNLGVDDSEVVERILGAEVLFKKGLELVRARQYDEALERLQEAIDLDPEEGEFHSLYGWAFLLVNRGDPNARAEGIQHLEKGISLAPKATTGYYYLGLARKACGEQAEAERMFRQVLELRPDHVEAARELRLFQMRRAKGN